MLRLSSTRFDIQAYLMSQGDLEAQATDLTLLHLTDSSLGESKLPVFFRQLNRRSQPLGFVLPISTLQVLQLQHVASQAWSRAKQPPLQLALSCS